MTTSQAENVPCLEDFSDCVAMEAQLEMHCQSQVGPVTEELCETICTPTLNGHDYFSSGAPEMSIEEMLEAGQED